ncbi:hypothetical protein [Shewanella benthica]|uniref:DUF11 domain-containing protein n=1 Tax=Shewanella benthica KT99 TaxID=314608 RepID=A9EHR7_9GAMM|nr:hypothetical protein [Shewanella benthica]EDP99828.1 hypothetical protein KT99_10478 [Shewanella benthica KT99]
MKLFQFSRFIGALGIALISMASLYGVTSLTPANASFFPQLKSHACLAEFSGTHLTCRANDIRVSEVTNVTNPDGSTPVECVEGQMFEFKADFTILTTATSRYGYGIWLPEGKWSAQDESTTNTCSVLTGKTDGPGVDLDGDVCADISKKAGFNPEHVYVGETITMLCRDDDNSGKADFNYCASWNQQEYGICDGNNPTPAGSPSKCRCETFDIDVFIQPDPPAIFKTLTSSSSHSEPGGTFSYTVSFTNTNTSTSLFITSLSDEIDIGGEGTFDASLDLWGSLDTVSPLIDGVYLTATNCSQPADIGDGPGEILPSGTYSCAFTVHIVDRDLPDDQSPELYDNLVILALEDKNGDEVPDVPNVPSSCAAIPYSIVGDHCSNEIRVQITNLAPTITVTKTANPTEVLEPGANVEFTITVKNDAAFWDSPLNLTMLSDTDFGDLLVDECSAESTSIALGATYSCVFTKFISGDAGDQHSNTVSATARDDENDEATGNDSAMVDIRDVPSSITLIKTATPTSVLETGDNPENYSDVSYNFEFGVNAAGVDEVTFTSLIDIPFGILTGDCWVDMKNGAPITPTALNGFMLLPGDYASCDIIKGLRGNSGDTHLNTATIRGVDEDGQDVDATDNALVTFTPQAPDTDMAFATSMLVVLELTNAGIENVTLTELTVLGVTVADGNSDANDIFTILNTIGGYHAGVAYSACTIGTVLEYSSSGSETYSCAFTIELQPGIENTDAITFLATGVDGIVAIVEDDEGDQVVNGVAVEVNTVE